MAACGSLQHIFENPLPENQTLFDSLSSWSQITAMKPVEQSSFTEIFGELHFKETSQSSSSFPLSSFVELTKNDGFDYNYENNKNPSLDPFSPTTQKNTGYKNCHKNSDSFSSMNSESLQLCTEGLGFESSDDVEDLKSEMINIEDWQNKEETKGSMQNREEKVSIITKHLPIQNLCGEIKKSRTSGGGAFPPPISCIGKSGKPWVCFKSYRQDGRFVLKEIRVPTQEFLHACREDGRLKLHFVQPNDEILEEDEDEEDYEENVEEEIIDADNDDGNEGDEERQADTERNEFGSNLQQVGNSRV